MRKTGESREVSPLFCARAFISSRLRSQGGSLFTHTGPAHEITTTMSTAIFPTDKQAQHFCDVAEWLVCDWMDGGDKAALEAFNNAIRAMTKRETLAFAKYVYERFYDPIPGDVMTFAIQAIEDGSGDRVRRF